MLIRFLLSFSVITIGRGWAKTERLALVIFLSLSSSVNYLCVTLLFDVLMCYNSFVFLSISVWVQRIWINVIYTFQLKIWYFSSSITPPLPGSLPSINISNWVLYILQHFGAFQANLWENVNLLSDFAFTFQCHAHIIQSVRRLLDYPPGTCSEK